jgi:Spy/CpxP family protein refolding chaperone
MNKILKLITISALAMALTVGAFAQAAGPQGGGVQGGQTGGEGGLKGKGGLKGNQKLEQEIWAKLTPALTPEQKTKLEQINQKSKDSFKALREKLPAGGSKESLKPELQKIMAERRESIKALLTPEQNKSYMELMKAAMEKMKKGKGGKGIGGKIG